MNNLNIKVPPIVLNITVPVVVYDTYFVMTRCLGFSALSLVTYLILAITTFAFAYRKALIFIEQDDTKASNIFSAHVDKVYFTDEFVMRIYQTLYKLINHYIALFVELVSLQNWKRSVKYFLVGYFFVSTLQCLLSCCCCMFMAVNFGAILFFAYNQLNGDKYRQQISNLATQRITQIDQMLRAGKHQKVE